MGHGNSDQSKGESESETSETGFCDQAFRPLDMSYRHETSTIDMVHQKLDRVRRPATLTFGKGHFTFRDVASHI